MVLVDENFMLFYVYLFPIGIGLTLLAVIWGFASVPTTILSLLLVGVVVEDFSGPLLLAYVLAYLLIVGYRVYRLVEDRYTQKC